MNALRNTLARVAVAAVIGGCAVGPNYHHAPIEVPVAYKEAMSTQRTATVADAGDLSGWWSQFNDPVLDDLVRRALANSLDLQAAVSRVRAARLQERESRAAEYPTVSAAVDALTFNTNRGSGSPPSGASGSAAAAPSGFTLPSHLNLFAAGLDATWELDLFGGARRSVEAAKANSEAALWSRRDGEVSLIAEVANDYLTLRAVQIRIAVGRSELDRQKGVFELISARRQAGFVTSLDVNQQTNVVETAASQLPQLEVQARVQLHSLAVLLGESPDALDELLAPTAATMPPPPPSLPTGLPSDLLRRRPDLREAERRVAASSAQIGVAVADRFPKLNLIGLASFAGTSIDRLFSSQDFATAAVGMGSAPLFDAGRRGAAAGVAREQNVQASLAYRKAVLGAIRDVEDALARYGSEETRREALARSVDAAKSSLSISQDQYKTGFVTFINVLQAENALLNAEDQLTQSDAQVLTDLVAIYKALGGGWST
jgi:outer membrane protein, multidrug efflux system